MKILGLIEAEYFCRAYTDNSGVSTGSLDDYYENHLVKLSFLRENSQPFSDYRSCLLRDVERNLFLSASNYRRCLDLLVPSASSWAYVTAYYGAWYAAHALLGMFGCAIFRNHVVDVKRSSPGSQEFSIRKIGINKGEEFTKYKSSPHKKFWDLFYGSTIQLKPLVPINLKIAITPISNDPLWQIEKRNSINYDSYRAIELGKNFQSSFSISSFPSSLPGILNTQYGVFEALIELSFNYAKQFNFRTDALSGFGKDGKIGKKIKDLIYYGKSHRLVPQTRKEVLIKI